MSARDRTLSLILVLAAVGAWAVVALIFTNLSPVGDAGAQLLGALALGSAVALTAWPLLWSASPGDSDGGHRSKLAVAGRRSALIGLVVVILVILRALDVVALPVLTFIVVSAVLVEIAVTLRR